MIYVIWKIVKGVAHLLLFLICCDPVRAEDTGHRGDHEKNRPLVVGYSSQVFYNVDPKVCSVQANFGRNT